MTIQQKIQELQDQIDALKVEADKSFYWKTVYYRSIRI